MRWTQTIDLYSYAGQASESEGYIVQLFELWKCLALVRALAMYPDQFEDTWLLYKFLRMATFSNCNDLRTE